MGDNATPKDWKDRKRAQRSVALSGKSCANCGKKSGLQRHHYKSLGQSKRVRILCQSCHTKADMKKGKWGKGMRKRASTESIKLLNIIAKNMRSMGMGKRLTMKSYKGINHSVRSALREGGEAAAEARATVPLEEFSISNTLKNLRKRASTAPAMLGLLGPKWLEVVRKSPFYPYIK